MNRFIYIVCIIFFFIACDKKENGHIHDYLNNIDINHIELDVMDQFIVGETITIPFPDELREIPLVLSITNSVGTQIFPFLSDLEISDIHTQRSGSYWLKLIHYDKIIWEKKIEIIPKKSHKEIPLFVGPKSIEIIDKDPTMIIGIPVDSFNNPIATNTEIEYQLIRPNRKIEEYTPTTEHLLSYITVFPQKKAGKTLIGINKDGAFSKERYFDELAGWPAKIRLAKIPDLLIADDRQFFTLKTLPIKDKLGNLVIDGTHVSFKIITRENNIYTYTGITVDGVAKISIKHPEISTKYTITAHSGNVKSKAIVTRFSSRINPYKLRHNKELKHIKIGPIITYLNQFIADGTVIEYNISNREKTIDYDGQIQAKSGESKIELGRIILPKGKYKVSVKVGDRRAKLNIFHE